MSSQVCSVLWDANSIVLLNFSSMGLSFETNTSHLSRLCSKGAIYLFKVSWYPKIDNFFEKYDFFIFRQILFKGLICKKFQKKRLFLRKVIEEKRFGSLIFSNYVLTVSCQQRRKYHVT